MCHGRTKECHDAIAHEFVERAFVGINFFAEGDDGLVNDGIDGFGVEFFGHGGKAHHVGKEDGYGAPLAFDLLAGVQDFVYKGGGDKAA